MSNECAEWMNEMRPIFEITERLEEKGYEVIDYDEYYENRIRFVTFSCLYNKEKFQITYQI